MHGLAIFPARVECFRIQFGGDKNVADSEVVHDLSCYLQRSQDAGRFVARSVGKIRHECSTASSPFPFFYQVQSVDIHSARASLRDELRTAHCAGQKPRSTSKSATVER
jgi:hypothetical protein